MSAYIFSSLHFSCLLHILQLIELETCPNCWVSHLFSILKNRCSYGICFGSGYALQNSTPNISTPNILSFFFFIDTRRAEKVRILCRRSGLYIYIYVDTYIYIYTCIIYIYIHVYRYIHICVYVYMCLCIYIYVYMYLCIYVCIFMYVYVYMYMYVYIYIHI